MTRKAHQPLHPYSVKIESPTGKSAALPVTLLTPKQAEEVQVEFKRLAHEAGIKGARINVQRVVADDYEKAISEAKARQRTSLPNQPVPTPRSINRSYRRWQGPPPAPPPPPDHPLP